MEAFETIDLKKVRQDLISEYHTKQQERIKLREIRKEMNQDLLSIKTELIRRNKILKEYDDNDIQEIKFLYENGTLDGYSLDLNEIERLKDDLEKVGRDYKSKSEAIDELTFEIEDLKKEEKNISLRLTFIKRKIDLLQTYTGENNGVVDDVETVIKCERKDQYREEILVESKKHDVVNLIETIKRTTYTKTNGNWYKHKPKFTSQVKEERNEELNQLLLLYKKTNN